MMRGANWKLGGFFNIANDLWSQQRSYLNHTVLSNYFRWALTPDRAEYAKAAIGGNKAYTEPDERDDFEEVKKRIDAWSDVRMQILDHMKKVSIEFNPYTSGLAFISSFLSQSDIIFLNEVVQNETVIKYKLEEWKSDIDKAMKKIDLELNNIRNNKSTIKDLRVAVDELICSFSERGYFRNAD